MQAKTWLAQKDKELSNSKTYIACGSLILTMKEFWVDLKTRNKIPE